MDAIIFSGPSLPPEAAVHFLEAEYRPPVSEGDVYRAALDGAAVIGLIDGYFENVPSVWHKEILWAMERGITVFGAASMGALRAAELDAFGMIGVGRIFRAYRDAWLEDDDEVAVIHGPPELGYPALSEAMVNIRRTLDAAVVEGVISPALRADLAAIAKDTFYARRSYPALIRDARSSGLPAAQLDALLDWLPTGRIDQKRQDAVDMLVAIKDHLSANPMPNEVRFSFEHTTIWAAATARNDRAGRAVQSVA